MAEKRSADMTYKKRHESDLHYIGRMILNNPVTWTVLFTWLILTVIYFGMDK